MSRHLGCCVIALLACLCPPPAGAGKPTPALAPTPEQGVFLSLSDLHFDPFARPGLVPELDRSPVKDWARIFAKGSDTAPSGAGEDSNYALMMATLKAAAGAGIRYDYVVHSGDFLTHDFQYGYQRTAGPAPQGYAGFVIKTMTFIGMQMRATLGKVPIYGSAGNNDAICGNYMIEPDSALLKAMAAQWGKLAKQPGRLADFSVGGYYKVPHPTVKNHDLIILNDIFWSTQYQNACGAGKGDPGAAQMSWLAWQLYQAQMRGRTATLVMHIPPGINGYSVSRSPYTCGGAMPSFWRREYGDAFLGLLEQFRSVVGASLAGHTHMDDFRVVSDAGGTPYFMTHITPSVSPFFGNTPSFSFIQYDRRTAALSDYAVFVLGGAGAGGAPSWGLEYVFRQAYGQDNAGPAGVKAVTNAIRTSEAARDKFIRYYAAETRGRSTISNDNWRAYSCAHDNLTEDDYAACYCPPAPAR